MAYLSLSNVGVDFVLYQTPSRSIKRTLMKTAVGGKIGSTAESGKTVVRALSDLSLDLRHIAEHVTVVLRKLAQPEQAMQRAARLISMHQAELGVA